MLDSDLLVLMLPACLLLAFGVRAHLIAENVFLKQQIQLLQARGRKTRRPDASARLIMALTSRLFEWRPALFILKPETLIRWHLAHGAGAQPWT